MKRLLPTLLFVSAASAGFGQSASDLANLINLLLHPPTAVMTITASQGDGTVCVASKVAGSTIYLTLTCSNPSGTFKTATLTSSGSTAAQGSFLLSLGDVYCVFLTNPTITPIPAAGSWTAIPAVSVGWQCSTNIRTNGSVSGQSAITAGSVSWP